MLKKMAIEAVQQRATQAVPKVLHAKLLYDNEKMDENGKPRSKGMGFIEFSEHEHALTALRALNNNPNTFSRARRPIVEFSIEDARAVRKLELKAKQREDQQKRHASKGEEKPRGAEQAAKRVAKKEKAAGGAPKRSRDDANRSAKPTSRADTDADAQMRGKHGKIQRVSRPNGGAPKMLQRAAEAKRDAQIDERRKRGRDAESVKPKKKPHGADKRDRTDDLIDRYFSADAKKGNGGLKDWL
jgi:nucleolar protein 4